MPEQTTLPPLRDATPRELARRFHELYERLAPDFGYTTREASAKPWAEVPRTHRALMVAVAEEVLVELRAWERVARDLAQVPEPGTFGWALAVLQAGDRVQRAGWNGKGLYLVYTPPKTLTPAQLTAEHKRQHPDHHLGAVIEARIDIRTASGSVSTGWRPTSLDMFATDWERVDDLPF